MKVRMGHVSNSSSSSFVILKEVLTKEQLDAIRNHIKYAQENFPQIPYAEKHQEWDTIETDEKVTVRTVMDNFNMREFLLALGIEDDNIEWKFY